MAEVKSVASQAPAPRSSIEDVELLAAFNASTIKIHMYKYTKKGETTTSYAQELRYVASDTPVLTREGVINTTGTIMFGPYPLEERMKYAKSSKFAASKGDGSDDVKPTFGTKTSGTFGALMLRINDVEFPNALADFVTRLGEPKTNINRAYEFCRKRLGSDDHPPKPEDAAKYIAAEDWRFQIPYRFKLVENKMTKELSWQPIMFSVIEYRITPAGGVEEVAVNVTRQNIHEIFARGTTLNIQFTLGNPTRQSASAGIAIWFATFNPNINIIVGKPAPRGERKANLTDAKKLELARQLAASAGGGTSTPASSFPSTSASVSAEDAHEQYGPPPDEHNNTPQGTPSLGAPMTPEDITATLAQIRLENA